MKKAYVILSLVLFSPILLSQNGTYRCNTQRFENENDPSKNKEHNNSMIVTIDINDITGGYVIISWPSENTTLKWDIIKKLDTTVNTEKKTVYTYYEARWNVGNVSGGPKIIAYFIQDMNDNTFHIAFDNPSVGVTNWYHNLTKITY